MEVQQEAQEAEAEEGLRFYSLEFFAVFVMNKLGRLIGFADAINKDPLLNDYYKKTYVLHKIVKESEFRHSYPRKSIDFSSLDELKAEISVSGKNNIYDVEFWFEPKYFLDKDGGFEAPKISLSHNLIENKTEVSMPAIGEEYEEHPLNDVLQNRDLKYAKMRFVKEQHLRSLLNFYAYAASRNLDEKQKGLEDSDPKTNVKKYLEIKYKGRIVVSEIEKLLN